MLCIFVRSVGLMLVLMLIDCHIDASLNSIKFQRFFLFFFLLLLDRKLLLRC